MYRFILALLFLPIFSYSQQKNECVQIYYDRGPEGYWMGRTYSIFIQNLVGHFPEVQQIVSPIELYQSGDLEKCESHIYVASYFENKIPDAFLKDFVTTTKRVAWLGYSSWKLQDQLDKIFGHTYGGLTTLNSQLLDKNKKPTFFKYYNYKGEQFIKFGDWDAANPKVFLAAYEFTKLIKSTNLDKSIEVLATAEHNGTKEIIPYAIRNKNKFLVVDVPFSYMTESDRYLIFCDLLFDILNKKPRRQNKIAFMRIEDVHPLIPIPFLNDLRKALDSENVPINLAIVPIFFDPLKRYDRPFSDELVTMDRKTDFLLWLKSLDQERLHIIWHGVTHQYRRQKNPHDGVSGSDYEFWLMPENKPVPEDSVKFILDRLNDGIDIFNKMKITPRIWMTPHYQASTLDFFIFGRAFPWNVGRIVYFNHTPLYVPTIDDPNSLWIKDTNKESRKKRFEYFDKYKYEITFDRWNGQLFPYEIFGDVHGIRILPENLGNSQPYENQHVVRPRTVEEIVADAKRVRVIRDSWASFFYHPFLLNSLDLGGQGIYPGDPTEMLYLIKEIKKLGYEFINIDHFIDENTLPIRPEPIYKGLTHE